MTKTRLPKPSRIFCLFCIAFKYILQNRKNESTLIMDDPTGIIPSCTLEKALLIAKKFLFCYAIFIGFNSVFWMIFSCCKSHTRKQG